MRVLFASLASVGHTYLLIPLAIAVRDAGHEAHFAAGENVHAPLLRNRLQPFRPADSFYEIYAEDLEPELARLQPDLVVHEWGLPGAAIAAHRAGIPGLWHGFGRMIPEGIGLQLPTPTIDAPRPAAPRHLPTVLAGQGLSRDRRADRTTSRSLCRTRTARVAHRASFAATDLPDVRHRIRHREGAHDGHPGLDGAQRPRGGLHRPGAPGATRHSARQRHGPGLGTAGGPAAARRCGRAPRRQRHNMPGNCCHTTETPVTATRPARSPRRSPGCPPRSRSPATCRNGLSTDESPIAPHRQVRDHHPPRTKDERMQSLRCVEKGDIVHHHTRR